MLGTHGKVLSCFGVYQPRELQDRTARRGEDDPFDVLGVSVDAVAVAGDDGYLGGGGHGPSGRSLVLVCF